jgi:Na+-transporting NADH:ubiquinone oxidoreductase subunit F
MTTEFFMAVGILAGICALLAVLLVIADWKLNDYGVCKISINEGDRELDVPGGSSLLSTLLSERIFIPSACGGGGSCGLCKLKVLDGGGPVLATEEPHLSKEEMASNVRLSCQLKVRNDMKIQIPEEYFKVREYQGKIERMDQLTHDIKLVRIELLEPKAMDFECGAYVQLEAPPYAKSPEAVYRAYSVAGDPEDKNHVDLIIRLVPNGICTTWVFEHLDEGDKVTLNGPHGDFRLQDTPAEKIFIAGGSGMAPFRSMLLQMQREQPSFECRYFFGAVSRRDMFYLDEMAEFEKNIPGFKFVPALSKPAPEDNWEGETGLITEVVDRHYPDCSDKEAYLCGSPGMIDACIKVLTKNGMPEDKIHYDKFA